MTAIDLGSNTFRAVRLDCATLEPLADYEKIVRTADGLVETGRISNAAVARILEAAREARARLGFGDDVAAVTTEAIRRAANAREVLERIRRETGIAFRTVTGKEEAAYTLLAVRTRLAALGLENRRIVMVDIGGGSTEIVFYHEGRTRVGSFPVGIVTIAQKYGTLERIGEALEEETAPMRRHLEEAKTRGFAPRLFVPTAGTPTTVAAMKLGMTYATYDPARVNGTPLKKEDLARQLERLLALDARSRRELVGVGREDLIAAGILIFDRLYDLLGFTEAVVVDDGLREGVAIAECRQLSADEILS